MLAGSETQNKITNGQVQYMHLRGAGKQYGILWYGDVSVFDSWGCKIYDDKMGLKWWKFVAYEAFLLYSIYV